MLRLVPRTFVRMSTIAATNSAPLRRSGRAQSSRSMAMTRAALIQETEGAELFAATVEETRVEVRSEEVRPARRRKRSVGSAEIAAAESQQDEVEHTLSKAKKRRKASKKGAPTEALKEVVGEAEEGELTTNATPKKKRKRVSKTESVELADGVDGVGEPSEQVKRRKSKKKKVSTTEAVDVVGTVDEFGELLEGAPVKVKRKRKAKEEPVYIIPDVEKKTTTFKGRLGQSLRTPHPGKFLITCTGYACLNTVLRNKKPAAESVFCSRTCRCVKAFVL